LTIASGSFSTRISSIEGNYATTGSNVFMGAQTVCANITSTGTIIAQTINVQQVTSSIVYSSGSNIFGNLSSDIQQMTGSLRITGSLNTIGNACATSICSPTFVGGTMSGTTIHGSTVICGASICTTGNTCFGGMSIIASCLGIGTTSPSQLLHLQTTLASSSGVGTAIQIESGGAGSDIAWIGVNKGTGNGLEISIENRDIIFNTGAATPFGGSERMRITCAGKVAINDTTNLDSLFTVNTKCCTQYNAAAYLGNASNIRLINGSACIGAYSGISFGGGGLTEGFFGIVQNSTCLAEFVWQTYNGSAYGERMRITSAGRVGIGETVPVSSLVVSTPSDTTSLGQSGIVIQGADTLTAGCVMALTFTAMPGTSRARAAVGSVVGSDWGKGNLAFYTRDASDATALSTADEKMRITSGGLVGIGTTTPCSILHVAPAASNSVIFPVIINNRANCPTTGYGVGIRLQNSTISGAQETNKWAGIAAVAGGSSGYSNDTDLAFYVGCFIAASNCTYPPVEKMRIQSSTGFVGIGTSCPQYLLDIPRNNNLFLGNLYILGCNLGPVLSSGGTGGSVTIQGGGVGEGAILVQGGTSGNGYITFSTNSTSEKLRITNTGIACFAGTVCAPLIVAPGTPLQVVYGKTTVSSGNQSQLISLGPSSNGTTPGYNCGCLLTSVSFTPKRSNSIILIKTNNISMWETQNVSDHFYLWASNDTDGTVLAKSGAYIQNINCISIGSHGAIVNLNEGACSWGTTAKTIAFRIGTTGSGGCFYQVNPFYGVSGFDASTVGHFSYIIMEIAQ